MKKTIILLAALALVISGCTMPFGKDKPVVITPDEAKTKTADFINNNLMQAGNKVTVKDVIEENGLYKVTVVMSNAQEIVSYLTKDGKTFFPQAMEIAKYEEQAKQAQTDTPAAQTPTEVPKNDKPKVELFVMSHCPYGTQIEKGIIPAVEKLGNKIDFELKFCDYAMHGEKEVLEQLNQYCIDKTEPGKLFAYLKCFLADGNGENCLKTAGINKSKMDSCVSDTEKELKIIEKSKDQSTWVSGKFPAFTVFQADVDKYSVQGSPTLVINGAQSSSGRDSASLLKSICAGFTNQPDECKATLSSDTPSAGFGTGTAASGSAAAGCAN